MEDDLPLTILVKSITDEFVCPICFTQIKLSTITPCGHNFCEPCILECLNRKHKCPCCNADTTKDKLVRNRPLDKLVEIVESEKKKAAKTYFENLVSGTGSQISDSLSGNEERSTVENKFSPIELIFQKHMHRSLASYEEYYKDIKGKLDQRCSETRIKYASLMAEETKKYEENTKLQGKLPETELAELAKKHKKEISKLRKKCKLEIKELEKSFEESVKMLLESYDEFMSKFAPEPLYLPITISIIIEKTGKKIDQVRINTTDSAQELKNIILKRFSDMGDPVIKFPENVQFVLQRFLASEKDSKNEIIINDLHRPLVQYEIPAKSTIVVKGDVLLESDKPQVCFASTFTLGAKQDYFTCKTCKINWVCKCCAENCHKKHDVVLYIKDHAPTWACCYCTKRKKCILAANEKS